ncbi:hypothetical protein KHQ84_gp176 [Rhodococcus phage Finch]|uniref:Uncharacterized protein n=1 Tax=Rhodococcus phage Finch TaxID=2094144 RepID=A0A2P1JXT5_9CAUD|nr:hypothetical protein KHQ84_gp176 [Rhodococcus phage Finch]AVO25166.1 hypothetical protein SEA_FINCH_176 [Rhodococcus phage Finch]
MNVDAKSLAKSMKIVLTVGAAQQEATPEQREQLKTRLLPYVQSDAYVKLGREEPIWAMLADIMGRDWKPSGEWAEHLAAL